jgi:hypothetical protein
MSPLVIRGVLKHGDDREKPRPGRVPCSRQGVAKAKASC